MTINPENYYLLKVKFSGNLVPYFHSLAYTLTCLIALSKAGCTRLVEDLIDDNKWLLDHSEYFPKADKKIQRDLKYLYTRPF